jgi:flagellar operon protein
VGPERVAGAEPGQPVRPGIPPRRASSGFEQAFREAELTLSKHASQRVQERQVDIKPSERPLVAQAVSLARSKGVKQLAVVLPDSVMVVLPASGTVVTAIGRQEAEQSLRLLTSIDAVVLVGRT